MNDGHLRIGFGFDAHRLVPGRPLILGGVEIPFPFGLLGHSDADVLTHALCDAVLGAAGLGDIGRHFPDSDPRFTGISSLLLLEETMRRIRFLGWDLGNADMTLVAEKPKIAPYADQMLDNLARACRTTPDRINIKATTTEGMGFSGTGAGMAAYAVAAIFKQEPP